MNTDKSDTPETDAKAAEILETLGPVGGSFTTMCDFAFMAEFARQLERELNEAKAQLAKVTEERDALLAACCGIIPKSVSEWSGLRTQNPKAFACEITYGDAVMICDAIAKVGTGADA